MRHTAITFLCCAISLFVEAQQDPLYSQYFNNPMLINPAFAGSSERLYAGIGYRTQWAGINGGPVTTNFNSHIALANNKVGAGLIVLQDKLGDVKNTQYSGTASYRIKLKNSTFSFGMQVGYMQYTSNLDGLTIKNPDPLFVPYTQTKFNTGAGVLLQSDRYTLGLSVPHILANTINPGGQNIQTDAQNIYLYGSYIFYVSEQIQFKPSTLLRATSGSPISADFNANFVFNRLYTAGLFTRKLNTYGILLQLVMENYRFGYVYEVPGKGSALNFNTHEVSLALSLDILRAHNHFANGL